MSCKSCGSVNQRQLGAELDIHFPGLKHVTTPPYSSIQYYRCAWIVGTRNRVCDRISPTCEVRHLRDRLSRNYLKTV